MERTKHTRDALALMHEEARRFHHEYVGTEHLFLALIRIGDCAAISVLNGLDVYVRQLKIDLEELMVPGFYPVSIDNLPHTPRLYKVIKGALEESKNLEHTYLGTEHLLLGLWREQGGFAAKVIHKLNIPIEDVREETLRLLREGINTGEHPPKSTATKRPRKIMTLANQEARRLHHQYIGTEHILLAIATIKTGLVPHLLDQFGITGDEVREAVEKTVPPGSSIPTEAKLPHTPNAKKVIEHAIEEARNLEHTYIGAEHLLFGILREEKGSAAQLLQEHGVTLEKTCQATRVCSIDDPWVEYRSICDSRDPYAK